VFGWFFLISGPYPHFDSSPNAKSLSYRRAHFSLLRPRLLKKLSSPLLRKISHRPPFAISCTTPSCALLLPPSPVPWHRPLFSPRFPSLLPFVIGEAGDQVRRGHQLLPPPPCSSGRPFSWAEGDFPFKTFSPFAGCFFFKHDIESPFPLHERFGNTSPSPFFSGLLFPLRFFSALPPAASSS